jgi:hypothetical protein
MAAKAFQTRTDALPTAFLELGKIIDKMKTDLDRFVDKNKVNEKALAAKFELVSNLIKCYNKSESAFMDIINENYKLQQHCTSPHIIDVRKRYQRQRPVIDHTGIDDLLTLSEHAQIEANQLYELATFLQEKNLTWYDRTTNNNHRTTSAS